MSNKTLTLGQAAAWCGGQIAPELEERPFFGANFDSRLIRPGELFAALPGARDGHDFAASALERGAAAVLASRPVDGPAIYVEDTSRALRDIARGYRESLPCRCVGITGSVGKTTTKEMIAAVLRTALRTQWTEKNYNNEIGLPVSVLRLKPDCEAAVLEMGMNHFGELSVLTRIAQPDLAVITNIGTMHIENLGSREGILRAKLEILEGLRPGGRIIFNGDDALLRPLARKYFTPGTHRTNADRLVGQEAVVTETIDNLAGAGQASIGGQIWTARGEDNTPIEAGARVQVLRIEGVKLIVRAE